MFVGHGLLAFAIAAWLAHTRGWARERTLTVGLLAGAFGLAPDVDILHAPVVVLERLAFSPEAFWGASTVAHRTVTHSLVVCALLVAVVALWTSSEAVNPVPPARHRKLARLLAVLLSGGLVVMAFVRSGQLGAVLMLLFTTVAILLAAAGLYAGVEPLAIAGAALVGLLTHPFGDLFTGTPPPMFYPFDVSIVSDVILLHPDPTLHLLGAFAIELSTVWLALLVYLRVDGTSPSSCHGSLTGRGSLGIGYAAVAPVLPAPTLDESYQFVFSVLAIGLLVALSSRPICRRPVCIAVTGVTAVTFAWLAYLLVYLGLG